ncbi:MULTISPECIES: efflux RND transporter periplasmic adaptor subunit [unclassified Phenylobacterium]|uniref:efflux RND transporter periplasmic adaptor subunit n=1 Tax=unclassified Phenylobacterium TaxID=2640670 RepID=UPI000839E793|nr:MULTISPECIES: efflux RND transporter periplasmic adaptor subunit [unclassified Phenylobacterium]
MRQDKTRLYGGVAAAILLAGLGGFGIAKLAGDTPATATPEAEEHHEGEEGAVEMTADQVKGAGILVQPVSVGGFANEVLAQATVEAAPNGQAVLTARAAGAVTRIYKRLGDPVRAGEPLAIVESREAAQIAADRSVAAARASLAQKQLAREKRLFEQRVSARQDYEQAQAEAAAANAEARRAQVASGAANVTSDGRGVVVSSPIAGRITAAPASLGAFVQSETELFRIADPQRIEVRAAISGADAPRVSPGDRAVVELADGRAIEGRVRSITPSLDAETRTATAVLDLPALGLQPGQTVRARIVPQRASASKAIVVPDEAIQSVEGRDVVFVRTAKGFQARPVTVGQRSAGRAEIVSGLTAGQVIAARNAFLLKAELGKGEGDEH